MRNYHAPGRSTAFARHGMAATSSPDATLAGLDVLRQGGTAVDAAITASAVLCITEPHMTGIGGDCFALVGEADGTVHGLNGSGRCSAKADGGWLAASGLQDISDDSVHAVTVPGAIDGWQALLDRFGTMDLKEALAPAIALAEGGVVVTPRVASDWAGLMDKVNGDEGARAHLRKDGRAPVAGEIMTYPALAATLKIIASQGRAGFYEGEVAGDIVDHLAARGGLLTRDDFAATRASWVTPIGTQFAGREVLEIPPNGQGITALIALNILSRLNIGQYEPGSAERRHLEIEAVRLSWVLRDRHIADPDQAGVPVSDMLSGATADRLAALISMDKMVAEPEGAVPHGSDTVYLCMADSNGLSVSFINSIFHGFGSGIVTPKTGITLQNRGAGFVTDPDHANCIAPGKRPLHTIIPAMVKNAGKVEMAFGVMGGTYQPMGHVAVMVNRYVYGMDMQQALDFPRAFYADGVTGLENTIAGDVARALAAKGHTIERVAAPFGGGQAIFKDPATGILSAGSDARKDGLALGY